MSLWHIIIFTVSRMSKFARRMTPLWCALLFAGTILLSNPQTGVVSKSPSVIINISPPPLTPSPPPRPPSPPPPPPSPPSPPPPPPPPSPPPTVNFGGSLIEFIALDITYATYAANQGYTKIKIVQIIENLLGYGVGSVNFNPASAIPVGLVSTEYLVGATTNLNTLPTLAKNFAQTAISSIAGTGVKSISFNYLSDGTTQDVVYYIDETTIFTNIPSSIKNFGDNLIPDSKKLTHDFVTTTVGTTFIPLKIYVPLAEIANARSKFLNLFTSPTIGASGKPAINSLFYNTYMQIPAIYLVDQITASQFTGMSTSGIINPTDVSSWQHSDTSEVMAINIPYTTYMSNVGEYNGKITLALTELFLGDYLFIRDLQRSIAGTTIVYFDINLPATSSTAISNAFVQFQNYFVDCHPSQGDRIGCPSGTILTQKLQSYGLPGAFYNQQTAAAPYTMRGYSNSYYSLRDELRRNILGKDVEGEFN